MAIAVIIMWKIHVGIEPNCSRTIESATRKKSEGEKMKKNESPLTPSSLIRFFPVHRVRGSRSLRTKNTCTHACGATDRHWKIIGRESARKAAAPMYRNRVRSRIYIRTKIYTQHPPYRVLAPLYVHIYNRASTSRRRRHRGDCAGFEIKKKCNSRWCIAKHFWPVSLVILGSSLSYPLSRERERGRGCIARARAV